MSSAIGKISSKLLYFIFGVQRLLFLRNNTLFYDNRMGSDSKYIIFLNNIIKPHRFVKKIQYGQVLNLGNAFETPSEQSSTHVSGNWERYADELAAKGMVIVDGIFADQVREINKKYSIYKNNYPVSDKYYGQLADLNIPEVNIISTHTNILQMLSKYYKRQPYLRHLPSINVTHSASNKQLVKDGFNLLWHYDTPNQLTAHVLLNDVDSSGTKMLYAIRSHKIHRNHITDLDYFYSEEYVTSNYEIVGCSGSAGSLIIFDPNGLHRVDLCADSFRAHLHVNYTPGNDIIQFDENKIDVKGQLSKTYFDGLDNIQKTALGKINFTPSFSNQPRALPLISR